MHLKIRSEVFFFSRCAMLFQPPLPSFLPLSLSLSFSLFLCHNPRTARVYCSCPCIIRSVAAFTFYIFPFSRDLIQTQIFCQSGYCKFRFARFKPEIRIFELGRQAGPGRQPGIRLYRPVPAEGQNKFWGHRLTAKAITYQGRHLNNK
jgi:hypothetical protein